MSRNPTEILVSSGEGIFQECIKDLVITEQQNISNYFRFAFTKRVLPHRSEILLPQTYQYLVGGVNFGDYIPYSVLYNQPLLACSLIDNHLIFLHALSIAFG